MASVIETKEEEVSYGQHMENLKSLCEKSTSLNEFLVEAIQLPDKLYVHFRWPHHESILHWAASGGCDDVCKYLTESGAYINAQNIHGCNPLFYASSKERLSTVELLLSLGADYNCTSSFSGGTPFNPNPIVLFGKKNEDSETRIKIKEVINENIKSREEGMTNSARLDALVSTSFEGRDMLERKLLSIPTVHGNKASSGYWGLSEHNADSHFDQCIEADNIVSYTTNNKTKWCRECLKLSEETLNRCAKCKNMWYCSRSCQEKHWVSHRKRCIKSST